MPVIRAHPSVIWCQELDVLTVTFHGIRMRDAEYFIHPQYDWQRRYEALRAPVCRAL